MEIKPGLTEAGNKTVDEKLLLDRRHVEAELWIVKWG